MNGFEVIHGWNATDHTVLLVYNTSMGMKIFTFWLPGLCEGRAQITFRYRRHIYGLNCESR